MEQIIQNKWTRLSLIFFGIASKNGIFNFSEKVMYNMLRKKMRLNGKLFTDNELTVNITYKYRVYIFSEKLTEIQWTYLTIEHFQIIIFASF